MRHESLRRRPSAARAALTTIAALLGCGGGATAPHGGGGGTPSAGKGTVNATAALAFSPGTLAVTAGDTVTFACGTVGHNVCFDAQAGAPADIAGSNANVSVTRVFATAGTYRYTCHIHLCVSTSTSTAVGEGSGAPGCERSVNMRRVRRRAGDGRRAGGRTGL